MRQSKVVLLLFTLVCFLLPPPVLSANISFSNISTQSITDVNQQLDANIQLTIDASDGTIYYLRGVFYKQGSTKYCGYTYNGNDWFNGPYTTEEGWKKLPLISIASGSGTLTLQSRFDPSSSNCSEVGDYSFKVQRYTQAGSATFDQQDPITINVSFPTMTPTPSKTPTSTKAPTSKPTEKKNTPIPTKQTAQPSVFVVSPIVTITTSPLNIANIQPASEAGITAGYLPEVLGEYEESSPSMAVAGAQQKNDSPVSLKIISLFMVSGAASIGTAVYLSIRNIKRKSVESS